MCIYIYANMYHVQLITPLVDTALNAGKIVSRRGTKRRCISGTVAEASLLSW